MGGGLAHCAPVSVWPVGGNWKPEQTPWKSSKIHTDGNLSTGPNQAPWSGNEKDTVCGISRVQYINTGYVCRNQF